MAKPINPKLAQLPDGTWTNGGKPISFGVHLTQIPKLGPVHIFRHNAVRSECGLARAGSKKYIYQSIFPLHHSVCRQCNHSMHFGNYGGPIHSHTA